VLKGHLLRRKFQVETISKFNSIRFDNNSTNSCWLMPFILGLKVTLIIIILIKCNVGELSFFDEKGNSKNVGLIMKYNLRKL
jgi:hypothetical protein